MVQPMNEEPMGLATEPGLCPDTGTCHHECVGGCFRVMCCAPLSAAHFPDDKWPAGCVEVYGDPEGFIW